MERTQAIDLDLYGRGFDGIFGDGSEFDSKKHALLKQKAMEDFKVHIKPGEYIDYDLYGRGDPRVFETTEGSTTNQESALDNGRARTRRFSPKSFLVPVKVFKKKLGAFARKLSGSRRNSGNDESPRNASVHSVTPIPVFEDTMNNVENAPVVEGESDISSPSPICDVPDQTEDALQADEGVTTVTMSLNDKNMAAIIESEDEVTVSETEEPAYDDRVDNVPRRVRSKLPSEEKPPHIEPGMVSKVIAKLNSASSFEFKQASSFIKKKTLLQVSPTAACAMTDADSSADRTAETKSFKAVSDTLSLTASSSASERETSSKSEIFDVSSAGRVERLRSLFQEKDSPGLFLFDMDSSYPARKPSRSGLASNEEEHGVTENSTISSPRDIFSASISHDQLSPNVGSFETKSITSKALSVEEGSSDVVSDSESCVDQPKSRAASVHSVENVVPHVPRGLSCDSHADMDDGKQIDEVTTHEVPPNISGCTAYVEQRANIEICAPSMSSQESDGELKNIRAEDAVGEDGLSVDRSQDSQTISTKSAERGTPDIEQEIVPAVADSTSSDNCTATVASEGSKKSQDTINTDNLEMESETRSQTSSDVFVEDLEDPVAPLDADASLSSAIFASIMRLFS
ncbi:hypothetical protein BWQ96_08510 [Gracilariopsis chorda]|uniref:Uncharacterized protein n=1 Tax=Gracilariopsis chorda TaxID=448386 RepID=A0A2V3IIA3_9FLOR|nr:hypothetical protein BWQ96_08510 [Gracilariopsis chorda]|eukprot:PXF41789.1 hypothetical protein BWQ96_08510 [Gracilariopsis chorda]